MADIAVPADGQTPASPHLLHDTSGSPLLKEKLSPVAGLSISNKLMRTISGVSNEGRRGSATSPLAKDPITQNIMDRKSMEHPPTQNAQKHRAQISAVGLDGALDSPGAESRPRGSLDIRQDDNLSGSASKEKKYKVSLFSRFRGQSKRRDSMDFSVQGDEPDDAAPLRAEGTEAAVFSQPIGYIPKYAEPPKYIKVRARGKADREFDRLFLAQELRGRTGVEIAQAGGHRIDIVTKMKHDSATWAMEFSQDGHYLAAGGVGHVVRVWAVMTSEADRREEEKVEEGAFSDNQGIKLSAPVFKSRPVQEYEGHTASILSLSWSKNNFLLSSSMDKTVRLWHVSRQECLCVFKHPDYVPAVQFHPQDDRFFLAGSLDSKLRLWSIPDKSVAYSAVVNDLITAVAFTPDGKTAIAGTLSGLCIFFDTEKLKEQSKMHVRSAHGKNAKGSKITGIQAKVLPPNDPRGAVKLLITSNDSRIRVYNLSDRSLELKIKGNENATSQIRATFSDDARHIICGSEDKKCYIWDMRHPDKDREKHPMEAFHAHNEIITSAIMAPTATKQLLQSSGDPVFEICNPPPVQLLSREETKSIRSLRTSDAPSEKDHFEVKATATGDRDNTDEISSPIASEPSSTFKSRSAHPGGHIILTADTEGRIKCFRSDCAYKNRLKNIENWDNTSTFSRKMLHRQSSISTRHSRNSISLRDSLIGLGQPSERILSWRQSIDRSHFSNLAGAGSPAMDRSPSLRAGAGARSNRDRSVSPRKSMSALSGLLGGSRRISGSSAMFGMRSSEAATVPHPLKTSVSNTPAVSSIAASSQHSLRSGTTDDSIRAGRSGARGIEHSRNRTLIASEFSALGIQDRKSTRTTDDRNNDAHSNEGDYTGDEEEEDDEKGAESDTSEAAQRCLKCGGDSFRAVKQGRASRATMLQCVQCGTSVS